MTLSRRDVLVTTGGVLLASMALPLRAAAAAAAVPRLRVTGFELRPVRATSRTVWLFVRLMTDAGLIGLGEASDGFGFANTTADDVARMRRELQPFFELIDGRSPFEIESYRQRGEPMARQGLVPAERFVVPAARFVDGTIEIPDRPGFGVALNQDVIRTRALAV